MHIELGKMQELMVVKKVDFGVYLAPEDNQEEKVLLPGKQVPEGCETGDFVTVFIYRDSKDRLIATRKEPKLSLGEVAVLTCLLYTPRYAGIQTGIPSDCGRNI